MLQPPARSPPQPPRVAIHDRNGSHARTIPRRTDTPLPDPTRAPRRYDRSMSSDATEPPRADGEPREPAEAQEVDASGHRAVRGDDSRNPSEAAPVDAAHVDAVPERPADSRPVDARPERPADAAHVDAVPGRPA